jgi:YD repeat-containing protein
LTGATLWTFGYSSQGQLNKITDGDGNVTLIEQNPDGAPQAIVAPFGQRTTLTADSDGYLAAVTNPAGETYQMHYGDRGLLTRFEDPNGHASTLGYGDHGRLSSDRNAAGGSQNLSRQDLGPKSYEVIVASALGVTDKQRVERLSTDDEQRTFTLPDNTKTTVLRKTNDETQIAEADGTQTTLVEGPDPRFGMMAPVARSLTTTTGGLTAVLTTERTADLADPANWLSLRSLTTTVKRNGRTSTRVYNAATHTYTDTTPTGRQS